MYSVYIVSVLQSKRMQRHCLAVLAVAHPAAFAPLSLLLLLRLLIAVGLMPSPSQSEQLLSSTMWLYSVFLHIKQMSRSVCERGVCKHAALALEVSLQVILRNAKMTMADKVQPAYAHLMPSPLHMSHITNLAGCASSVSPAREDVHWREASELVRDGFILLHHYKIR
jgi:hypothetical protein